MTETQTEPRLQGIFEWSDGKSIHIQARFDKVALNENKLTFISLVAFSQDVKALRAAFATGLDSPIRLKNVTLSRDDEAIVPGESKLFSRIRPRRRSLPGGVIGSPPAPCSRPRDGSNPTQAGLSLGM